MNKVCRKCLVEKPLSDFTRRAASGDGYQARCKACLARDRNPAEGAIYYARHKEKESQRKAAAYIKNKDKIRDRNKKYNDSHKDRERQYSAWYYATHSEHVKNRQSLWAKNNRDKHNAKGARRRASLLLATPSWANQFFISEAYDLAKLRTTMLGFEWNVDHIVPLKSKLVCGLHVENNLQVIPATVNRHKAYMYWPDMPEGV